MAVSQRVAIALLATAVSVLPAYAQTDKNQPPAGEQQPQSPKSEPPAPLEKNSVTHHELSLNGRSIKYTATAGTLTIKDEEEKPYGSLFYVAYTLDGTEAKSRPVSFLYNGGPGSATLWLHMGSFGPVRVVTSSPDPTPAAPFKVVPNEFSLLDKTDLVFIDAPMTGFSRAAGKATAKDFAGVDQDLRAFDKFIERYITVNQRWNSPKYLIGESYGTTRSAALADMLQNNGVELNGVVLISSILNYAIRVPGYDSIYIANLPSYAAAAWYFNKLQNKSADLKAYLDEVRAFASGPYAAALYAGDALSATQADSIAQKISQYTGLSIEYIKEANLRVSPTRFRKELLRTDRRTLGRYDMRFEGIDIDAAGENPSYDPSDTGIGGAFIGAFHDYLQRELKYDTQESYKVHGDNLIQSWDWKHKPTSGAAPGNFGEQNQPYVAADLASAIRKNPKLKVFSANGYYDLATPFFATEFDLAHVNLDANLRKNIEFGYYPSGHMIYLNVEALKQLKSDLASFYTSLGN